MSRVSRSVGRSVGRLGAQSVGWSFLVVGFSGGWSSAQLVSSVSESVGRSFWRFLVLSVGRSVSHFLVSII